MNVLINAVRLIACLIEPYMPSYSAKVYKFLNLTYDEYNSHLLKHIFENNWEFLLKLVPEKTLINEPKPIFKESKLS